MLCLVSQQNDPYFNLAAEEYFLKNTNEEMFMLYTNSPSIVAGKHQNILREINNDWVRENNIIMARRLTGGGTVYHDLGNLNFSFISNCSNLEEIDYKRITHPIVLALNSLGVSVYYSGRNDFLLEERKVSGLAMHIFRNRVLCHGTLLFNSELKNLSCALKNKPDKYIDKSIKSIASKVANISDFLTKRMTMNKFTSAIFEETCKYISSPSPYSLNETEISEIVNLSKEKYSTWDWIFGYSPKYLFRNEIILNDQSFKVEFSVEKGIIRGFNLEDKTQSTEDINLIFNHLMNEKHDFLSLKEIFSKKDLLNRFHGLSSEQFCSQLF